MFLLFIAAGYTLPETAAGSARKNLQHLTPRSFVAMQKKDPYRARVYVECGIEAVTEADYDAYRVTVFHAPTALSAMCAYGTDKTLDGNPLPTYDGPQSQATRQPGSLHLWRGTLYLRIRGKGGEKPLLLLRALAATIPNPPAVDPAILRLRELPNMERIPGSDRYIAKNVYGWTSFAHGYSADYACGDASLSIANIDTQGGAEHVMNSVLEEAQKRGYAVTPWKPALNDEQPSLPKQAMQATGAGGPTLYVLRTDTRLIAVDADIAPTACMPLLEELLRMLVP